MADYTVAHDGLYALLQSLPENTATTAYSIELSSVTAEFLNPSDRAGTIGAILAKNPRKYASLTFGDNCQAVFAALTDANRMFAYCISLVSIELPSMPNVTDASYMFAYCTSLVSAELPSMPNVTDANHMFDSCSSLVSIELPSMPNVTDARNMFDSCSSLVSIHGWDIPVSAATTQTFIWCTVLEAVYVPSTPSTDAESWRSFAVSHGSGTDDTVTVYGSDGSTEATATVPNAEGRSVEATDWVDELILSDAEIPGAKVADMMATRLPVTGDMNAADPSEDTFTLWVKNGDRKRVNMKLSDFTNDMKLSDFTNDMSLSDFTNDLLIPVGRPANVQVGSIWLG